MGPLGRVTRLFHTVRHLRAEQVIGRIVFRMARPAPDLSPAPTVRRPAGEMVIPAARRPSMTAPGRMRFLNVERDAAQGWDDPAVAKLWRYNLHYFDDLCAEGSPSRRDWHVAFMDAWIRGNPPGHGTAWEPYPTSLRIVNWVKWAWLGGSLPDAAVQSLAVQARWMTRRLERHLLGNHLFANAKALVFAGCFFEGPEADRWFTIGTEILRREIPEQVLPDGGQFERSPMYHALALEDMIDLSVALRMRGVAPSDGFRAEVERRIAPMRRWLAAMCHPDGEVAFFNDCAIGIHPSPAQLNAYAERAGFGPCQPPADGITVLPDSGFVRLQRGDDVLLMDVGPVGPDYLPGHAHADTLSIELSVGGQRVLVNSGTSEYGLGPERLRQRGTPAHNTAIVAGADSSEVWGGFRVARRARPFGLQTRQDGNDLVVRCGHDGYRRIRRGLDHVRTVTLSPGALVVQDEITADESMVARYHWAPAAGPAAGAVRISCEHASCRTVPTTWHPEFGVIRSNSCTEAVASGRRCIVRLDW